MTARVLIAVTHLLGAGHLVRAAAIGRALVAAGAAVTLVSGGRPAPLIDTRGLALVQLPPVASRIGEFGTLRDEHGREIGAGYLDERRRVLLAAVAAARPDVVVTELYPFGRRVLAAEFGALLAAAAARGALVAASVRDILAPPSTAAKARITGDILARWYDLVLVHGDPSVAPLSASWPVDDALARQLVYTGYVDPEPTPLAPAPVRSREVVVSGGSSVAGLPLYRAALAAARDATDLAWRILVGAGVPASTFEVLRREAGPNVVVERARPDFRHLLRSAGVFAGQAGYNTVMDLLATGVPALLVPFEDGGETEQRLRATELAARGLARLLPESELSPDALRTALRAALDSPPSPAAAASIPRDGAARSAAILLQGLHAGRLASGDAA